MIKNERKISPHYVVVKVALYDDLINWDEVDEVDWLIECIDNSELIDFRDVGVGDTIGEVIKLLHIDEEPEVSVDENDFIVRNQKAMGNDPDVSCPICGNSGSKLVEMRRRIRLESQEPEKEGG